jgi:transposase-like protein
MLQELRASVTEVARRFGVSRQSVYAWLRRHAADQGLGDRSSRPHGCPHQMSPATVKGHEDLPGGGRETCPVVAVAGAR